MLLSRPRRKLIFGVIFGALLAIVAYAVLWSPSDPVTTSVLTGFPVSRSSALSYYTFGATRWLIVERQESGAGVEHNLVINGPGLLEALVTIVFAALSCRWAWRFLVARLSRPGFCDWCGYNLTGLTTGRCPECGRAMTTTAEAAAPGAG